MPNFSKKSREQLETCDKRLQDIMNIAIQVYDFSVLCGHRSKDVQHNAFLQGYSKVDYPNSRHNKKPSGAVDIVPWFQDAPHVRYDDIGAFEELSRIIKAIAIALGYKITWGGSWDWKDYPHYQLEE